jgi:hypothetical protein
MTPSHITDHIDLGSFAHLLSSPAAERAMTASTEDEFREWLQVELDICRHHESQPAIEKTDWKTEGF